MTKPIGQISSILRPTYSMLLLICILLASYKPVEAKEGAGGWSIPKKPGQCLAGIGEYIFLDSALSDYAFAGCEIALLQNSDAYREEVNALKRYRSKFSAIPVVQLHACHERWNNDWNEARAKALMEFRKIESEIDSRKIKVNLSPWEHELLWRSLMDQAVTVIAMESGRFYQRRSANSCDNIAANVSFVRSENIAFVKNHDIAAKFIDSQLDTVTYRPLWFIIQHADLYLDFQKNWLERFRSHKPAGGLSERLINSLEERVRLAEERIEKAGKGLR